MHEEPIADNPRGDALGNGVIAVRTKSAAVLCGVVEREDCAHATDASGAKINKKHVHGGNHERRFAAGSYQNNAACERRINTDKPE
jgi:hypothetical protein